MHSSDVIMFMSYVSFGLRKGVELVEALASGHTQDSKKVCLTGTVCFKNVSHKGPLGV